MNSPNIQSASPIRFFAISTLVTLLALVFVALVAGPLATLIVAILVVLELTFSFDNAVVNAKLLRHMSPLWRRMFLTVGIVIAVLGMRVVFPVLVVALSAHLSLGEVFRLAIQNPEGYAHALHGAHATIAAFGGAFLLMLCLAFLLTPNHDVQWIPALEKRLQLGHPLASATVISLLVIVLTAVLIDGQQTAHVAFAGGLGICVFLAVHGLSMLAEKRRMAQRETVTTGTAGLIAFLYLELIDASFSFDGVIGAFAITSQVLLIAVGLGVGAIWVRSMTVFMVHRRTLETYRYLEHGAHYAIGALALTLLVGLKFEIPDFVSGLIGLSFILAAALHSVAVNKREKIKVS